MSDTNGDRPPFTVVLPVDKLDDGSGRYACPHCWKTQAGVNEKDALRCGMCGIVLKWQIKPPPPLPTFPPSRRHQFHQSRRLAQVTVAELLTAPWVANAVDCLAIMHALTEGMCSAYVEMDSAYGAGGVPETMKTALLVYLERVEYLIKAPNLPHALRALELVFDQGRRQQQPMPDVRPATDATPADETNGDETSHDDPDDHD